LLLLQGISNKSGSRPIDDAALGNADVVATLFSIRIRQGAAKKISAGVENPGADTPIPPLIR
jgi:hypothetical protein